MLGFADKKGCFVVNIFCGSLKTGSLRVLCGGGQVCSERVKENYLLEIDLNQ